MITSIKNADYSFLFSKAGALLLELDRQGKLSTPLQQAEKDELNEFGRFSSLEKYFTRLGDLVDNAENPIEYLMLPLDEPCLEVDANTRIITIPEGFKKYGAGVQGDVIAETLFLRIDRFFDSMDFMMTEPYIQWKLKNGEQGATPIPYMDYESEHHLGKLIIVWPLTGAVTAQEGPVEFSLRFIKRDGDKIVYSWNSVPASITIKKALKPEVDYVEYDEAASLFKLAIANSKHTSDSDTVEAPSFEAPGYSVGFDAPIAHLNANNALTLEGQAWVEGQGHLSYDWQYTNLAGNIVVSGANVQGAETAAFRETADDAPVPNKVYYIKNESATPYGYEELPHNQFDTTEETIYERYAIYKITESISPAAEAPGVVTGTYKLIATHKLGFPSADKELVVKVPGPEVLEFVSGDDVKEAGTKKVIGKAGLAANGTLIDADGRLVMSVEVNNDNAPATAYQSMSYKWMKNTASAADEGMQEIVTHSYDNESEGHVGETVDGLEIASNAEPGWYKVIVTSMLNRDTDSIESNVARVTKAPVAPTLKFPYNPDTDNVDLVDADDFIDRQVELKIEHNAYPTPIELHSDKLIYEWYNEDVLITKDTPGFTMSDNKLIIDGSLFSKQKMVIECYVSNELNGAISEESSRSGIFMISF